MQKGKQAEARSSNSSKQNKARNENWSTGIWGDSSFLWAMHFVNTQNSSKHNELDFSSQLEATQKSVHSGIIMRTCVSVRRSVLAVPQRCLEAATNAPNYKTTCEDMWELTSVWKDERDGAKPGGSM